MIRIGRWQFSIEGVLLFLLVAGLLLGGLTCRRTPPNRVDAALRHELDSLRKMTARVDTQYLAEKKVYAGWRERWDTARVAHLERALDSLRRAGVQKPETVKVEVPMYILIAADSTIRSCNALVVSCEESRRLLGEQVRLLNLRLQAIPAPPTRWELAQDRGKWGAIGYGVGKVIEAVVR